eukprot:11212605-Lingulodinium_polyedra.AAC.1
MRGAAAFECISEHISEQLSHESCSEMRSGTHANAAAPCVVAKRAAPCKHHFFGVRMERAFCKHAQRRGVRMHSRMHF